MTAVQAASPAEIGVSELIKTLGVGTKHTIRSRVKALHAAGKLVRVGRGLYRLGQVERPNRQDFDGDDGTISYPVAPNGHGASETGRDNEDAEPSNVRIPPRLMRRLFGGRLPATGLWSFAAGTSAEPFIPNGHPIFIEPHYGDLIDGARYAVWMGHADADVVKRIELVGDDKLVLRADNPNVSDRVFTRTEDDEEWRTEDGGTMRLVIRGMVTFPPDTPAAIVGGLEQFARRLLRP